jgi:uncharacterized protein (DUF433 family)
MIFKNLLLRKIVFNPKLAGGKPILKKSKIQVSEILNYLATGISLEELLTFYPKLERDDLIACLQYYLMMNRGIL